MRSFYCCPCHSEIKREKKKKKEKNENEKSNKNCICDGNDVEYSSVYVTQIVTELLNVAFSRVFRPVTYEYFMLVDCANTLDLRGQHEDDTKMIRDMSNWQTLLCAH